MKQNNALPKERDSAPGEDKDSSSVRLRKYVTRGHVYVPLTASKLSAKSKAEWRAAEAERATRTVKKKKQK
jgi:hypothetical protein